MELSVEQINEFKKQIIQQIESTFPEDKRNSAIENINLMNESEFIEFLKKNKLISSDENSGEEEKHEEQLKPNQTESPFRLIIEGKIPSYILDENKDSLAVLDIKPISKAHTLIIPKKSIEESGKIPQSAFSLAKKLSKIIKTKLNPKEILISSSYSLGEMIINVLPIYSGESLASSRKQTSKEELEGLKEMLGKKQKIKHIKKAKIKKLGESKLWLPRRIP